MLILPAGEIEPDPAVAKDSVLAVNRWSASIGLIVQCVRGISVVPAVVSGVLLPRFQRHPLTWIRRRSTDRQRLGTALQVLARASSSVAVRLSYGQPIADQDLGAGVSGARAITEVVVERARLLMQCVAQDHARPAASPRCTGRSLAPADGSVLVELQ